MSVECGEIIGWNFKNKSDGIPPYSHVRKTSFGLCWDLSSTDVDMVPRGLKGIDMVILPEPKSPFFIAPDFQGIVGYLNDKLTVTVYDQIEVMAAKKHYIKYKNYVESPRCIQRKSSFGAFRTYSSECVLPNNISFYQKEGKVILDISKTKTDRVPQVYGVDEMIILPAKKIRSRKKMSTFPQGNCKS